MLVGRELAAFADAAATDDWLARAVLVVREESRDAADAVMRAKIATRVKRVMEAACTDAIADADSLPYPGAAPEKAAQFVDLELVVALNVSQGTATRHRHRAAQLRTDLPATLEAMREGRIGEFHAICLLDMCRDTRAEDLLVDAEPLIWERAGAMPSIPVWRAAAQKVLKAMDPHAFTKTHRKAREGANVRFRCEKDTGMGIVSAYLPVADAAIVMNGVQARAEALRASGAEGGIGQLRAVAITEIHSDYLQGRTGLPEPRSHGRPVQVQVTAPVETVLALAELPGEIVGYGPVPAESIRDLAREARTRLLTICGQTGRLIDYGRATYRPSPEQAAALAATYPVSVGPGSQTPANRSDIDHRDPHGGQAGGKTELGNLYPLDRRSHNAKTFGGWHYQVDPKTGTVTWTSPLGQTTTTKPYDYRQGP